jgi:hypothetical protein
MTNICRNVLTYFYLASSAVVKSEKVVVAVVASWATNNKVEGLGKFEGLLNVSVDDEVATDKSNNAVVKSWLSIKSDDLVLDAWHGNEFLHD